MKKFILSFIVSCLSLFSIAQTTVSAPYCSEEFDLQYNSINTLTIGAFNHSFGPVGSSTNTNTYLYYNNVTLPNMLTGSNVNMAINFHVAPDVEPMYYGVFIDFNQDADFSWPDEMVLTNLNTIMAPLPCISGTNITVNGTVTIPTTAVGGTTRMRIIRTSDILGATPTIFDPINDFIIPCNQIGFWPNFVVGCAYDFDVNIIAPQLNVSPLSLASFNTIVGTPTAPQTFNVSGSNLSSNVTIGAPTHFEVSLTAVGGYGSSVSLTPTAGSIPNTTIYVRYNPSAAGTHSGFVINATTGLTPVNVLVQGTSTIPIVPTLTATPTTLTPFTAFVGYPSAVQSYSLSGVYLNGNVNISAPAEFEISTTATSGFGSSIILTPVSGTLAATTIYVRYNPSLAGTHNGVVSNWSTGANTIDIPVTGTSQPPPPPSFTLTPNTLNQFNTIVGIPSATQTISVAGTFLVGDINLTLPAPFEMSLVATGPFTQNLTLTPLLGVVGPVNVYIRFNPSIPNTYTGDLTVTSLNVPTVLVPLSGIGAPNTPVVTVTPNNLQYFITTFGIPSPYQLMTVQGMYLVDPLVVNAPTNFQVSTQAASGYGSYLQLMPTATGAVSPTTVYVRYHPLTPGNHQGNMSITSTGALSTNMLLNGYAYPTSLNNMEEDAMAIYPTSAQNNVFVSDKYVGYELQVYDFTGKLVMKINKLEKSFSVSHLSQSVYLLKLTKDEKSYRTKLIKE